MSNISKADITLTARTTEDTFIDLPPGILKNVSCLIPDITFGSARVTISIITGQGNSYIGRGHLGDNLDCSVSGLNIKCDGSERIRFRTFSNTTGTLEVHAWVDTEGRK